MNYSIEQIWQRAYEHKEALEVPPIHNLYERKSANLVDAIEAAFLDNRKALIWGAIALFVVLNLFGLPFLAVALPSCLGFLIWRSTNDIAEYSKLDKTAPSYDYIIEFYDILQRQLIEYANLYRWMYPLMLALILLQAAYSDAAQLAITDWQRDDTSLTMLWGVPMIIWGAIGIICAAVSVAAKRIYAWDVDLYYGRQFEKLDEIVMELKSLKAPN